MIEFYGEVSDYTKVRADKLKKRYFGGWLGALAAVALVVAVIVAFVRDGWGWAPPAVCAVVLGGVAAWLFMAPRKKTIKAKWLFRVTIEEDTLTFTQYLGEKTVTKQKRVSRAKYVYKTSYCYYIVFNDISNAVICERRLLRRGTFDRLEQTFAGKLRALRER